MLFGEHAVLHGRRALVCAVERRIHVTLSPRTDDVIAIASTLGPWRTDRRAPEGPAPLRFVIAAIRAAGELSSGFDLVIESAIDPTIGFGSSAAVTVAVAAALDQWRRGRVDAEALFAQCRATVRAVQGRGSGADVAASTLGGLVLYRAEPSELRRLPMVHPLTAVYSGAKTPTPQAVAAVEARRQRMPEVFERVFDAMDSCSGAAAVAAEAGDWRRVGALMDVGQGLLAALGVDTPALANAVFALRAQPSILGAKISGAGLGDCAVGFGRGDATALPGASMVVAMADRGVWVESR
jgi:mevalonate kinase